MPQLEFSAVYVSSSRRIFDDVQPTSFQYTMLSGKAPFQSSSHRDCSAAAIMERIKGGEFNTACKEFELVSDQAKKLVEGK